MLASRILGHSTQRERIPSYGGRIATELLFISPYCFRKFLLLLRVLLLLPRVLRVSAVQILGPSTQRNASQAYGGWSATEFPLSFPYCFCNSFSPSSSSCSSSSSPSARKANFLELPMAPSGISIRKSSAPPLPTSIAGGYEEKPLRGSSRGGSRMVVCGSHQAAVYAAVVLTSLVWVVLLHVTGVRDWAILCGRDVPLLHPIGTGNDKHDVKHGGYGLSYIASSQNDGVGSGLVELVDGEGKRSELVRPQVVAFVGINTGFDSGPRRKVVRETWFPSTPEGLSKMEESTGLVFRFVIGHTVDAQKMKALEEEVEEHKDFMLIDVDEKYSKLTLKTLAFFRTAFSLYDADFYMKMDDDIYLRPDRLAALLSKPRESPRVYLGCMKKGPVITDPKYKWYEPQAYMIGTEYFLHAYGPIYALSKEVVANLAATKNQRYRMFINEDVTIGVWMLAMDVVHEDNRAICATQCGPTSVAVWDLPKCSGLCNPTKRMLELHKDDMCSKSP